MKRLISLLLLLCLLCPCFLLTGCQTTEDPGDTEENGDPTGSETGPSLSFTLLANDTYRVSKGGLGYAKTIVIPETYNGKPVTEIAPNGFANAGFETITIPESIQVIGAGAFSGCADFKHITLPQGITEIGDNTFNGCVYLEEINIPAGVTRIGSNAFSGCTSLTSVTVPEGVTEIGNYAFWCASNIASITLPNSLKTVGARAFFTIGDDTLTEPHALQYNLLDGNKYLGNTQNPRLVLVDLGDKTVDTYTVHSDTRIIGSYAFNEAVFTSITLHDEVTNISERAFRLCKQLTSIHIPDKVTVIGSYAFVSCSKLATVTGLNFIERIEDGAFSGCSRTSSSFSINIGATLKSIGRGVFPSENALKCTTDKNVSYIGNAQNPYMIAIRAEKKSSSNNYTINANTKIIYESSFDNCDLVTDFIIPEGVFLIAYDAFYHCDNLSYVSLPNSLEIIMEDAFHTCKRLPSIVVPQNVVYIGDGAFEGCSGMSKITLPFVGRTPNGGGNALFGSIFDAQNISQQVSRVPKALHTVVITGSSAIGNAAFSDCEYIESITLPSTLTYIGEGAFFFAKKLQRVYIEDIAAYCAITMVNAASTPFAYNASLYVNNKRVSELVIPDGATKIGSFAFMNALNITKVTIPDSVTMLGDDCFKNCRDLAEVQFGTGVKEIKSSAFENCTEIEQLTLPVNLEILESSSLRGCNKLTEITLPKTLRFIGDRAFKSCDALEKVTFENKSGWQVVTNRIDTEGDSVFLWLKGKNALYLTEEYTECYWVCHK